MKRIVTSLPFRLLLGVVIGIIAGQLSGTALMNIVVTVKFVLGELINFCVPLIIIGFIAPSITRRGKMHRACWVQRFSVLMCHPYLQRFCLWAQDTD